MLEFLVTSKARRRLLLLLWAEGARGSASELAARAGVGFASAYRELQGMRRLDLVHALRSDGALTFEANTSHPQARALKQLLEVSTPSTASVREAAAVRSRLATLGAPVLARTAKRRSGRSLEELLVDGVELAHRDPAVARTMPVTFFRQRDDVDPDRLAQAARGRSEKAAVGMFLELTTAVSGDRRFSTWAKALRDRRVHVRRPFFHTRSASLRGAEMPDLGPAQAHRWGYRLDLSLADFQSMFDKAARAA
ncbi:MAG: hypothetical protein ABI321_06105 [Polyangia bacterium]